MDAILHWCHPVPGRRLSRAFPARDLRCRWACSGASISKPRLDYSFVLGIPSIAAAALVSLLDMGDQAGAVGAGPL